MAVCNRQPKQKNNPKSREPAQAEDPDKFYDDYPSWNFKLVDTEMWPFVEECAGIYFWSEILPRLQGLETQTWGEIFIRDKKFNHSESVNTLNKVAQQRLAERFIELDSIYSLRVTGTHRIYGYITKSVFNILWYDTDHGDNSTCVCRSEKKHT